MMKLTLVISIAEEVIERDDLEFRLGVDLVFMNGIINRITAEKRPNIILQTESTIYTYESPEQLADIYRKNRKIAIHWEGEDKFYDSKDPLEKQYQQ